MNQGAFAAFIGTNPATINSIYSDRTKPSLNIVAGIKKHIPNINTDWIIFGEGDMYTDDYSRPNAESDASMTSGSGMLSPMLDFDEESAAGDGGSAGGLQGVVADPSGTAATQQQLRPSAGVQSQSTNAAISAHAASPTPADRTGRHQVSTAGQGAQRPAEVQNVNVKYIDKPQRKITEIRIFFSDGTFETFEPKK